MTAMSHQPYFSTTLNYARQWGNAGNIIPNPNSSPPPHTLFDEIMTVVKIVREARHANTLVLDSSNGHIYPDVLATVLIGLLLKGRRPAIAMVGEMWQPNDGLRGRFEKLMIRLADRVIDRYFVYSTEELTVFPKLWDVEPAKMRLLPFFYSFDDNDLSEPPPPQGTHIFAGGNANRDYRPLVEAARQLPDHEFIIATRKVDQIVDPPPNVTAGPVEHTEFVRLMRSAAAVVVATRRDLQRTAGQQTYLNAMYLKKPTIVSNVFGVQDHITDGVDALVVDGSPQSYVDALCWMLDKANATEVRAMCEAGHAKARDQFSVTHFVNRLVALTTELEEDRRAGRL